MTMGVFDGVYCMLNSPYECEFVYDLAEIGHRSDFKCNACDIQGERQHVTLEDEEIEEM